MDTRNLLTVTGSNLRLNIRQTLFPAILLLIVIPLIYGTSHLDSIKSADCLERMAALIGLLASTVSRNTIVGFLVSFCWYLILQTENFGIAFKSVSNGVSVCQALLLLGSGAAIVFFSRLPFERKARSV